MSAVQKPVQFRSEGGLRDLREAVKLPISLLISIAKTHSLSPPLSGPSHHDWQLESQPPIFHMTEAGKPSSERCDGPISLKWSRAADDKRVNTWRRTFHNCFSGNFQEVTSSKWKTFHFCLMANCCEGWKIHSGDGGPERRPRKFNWNILLKAHLHVTLSVWLTDKDK